MFKKTPMKTLGLRKKMTPTPTKNNAPITENESTPVKESCITHDLNNKCNNWTDIYSTPKRPKLSRNPNEKQLVNKETSSVQKLFESENISEINTPNTELEDNNSTVAVTENIDQVKKRVLEKRIELSKLRSVTSNSKQHDLVTLETLIKQWLDTCQEALNELLTRCKSNDPSLVMIDVLNSLNIPPTLVRYSETDMDFIQ